LLLNIVDPSLDVREGYQIYTITTRDNRQLTGTLLARSEHLIAIQPYGSIARIELSTKEIVDMEASSVSMMPGGILESMGDQEVQDLFAYLMSDLPEL
jgi:putative heme-binding domain-containing protein